MTNKWYSNELKEDEVADFERSYALITNADLGIHEKAGLSMTVGFTRETGSMSACFLHSQEDMTRLFEETRTSKIKQLEGKVIEVYVDLKTNQTRAISINPHLV